MNNTNWPLLFLLALCCLPVPAVMAPVQAQAGAAVSHTSIINSVARRHGVDAALIRAVIKVESNFNPEAVSPAGAIGLMQLLPATAADYGVDSRAALFDPETNVVAGTLHLKRLLRKYKNISRALAAYNAGEGNALGFRRNGISVETRKYVVSVIRYYQEYRKRR